MYFVHLIFTQAMLSENILTLKYSRFMIIETVAQAKVIFAPYSPIGASFQSSEEHYNKIFQVCTASRALLTMAFSMVTSEDCVGYIYHSGYIYFNIKINYVTILCVCLR